MREVTDSSSKLGFQSLSLHWKISLSLSLSLCHSLTCTGRTEHVFPRQASAWQEGQKPQHGKTATFDVHSHHFRPLPPLFSKPFYSYIQTRPPFCPQTTTTTQTRTSFLPNTTTNPHARSS